MTEQEKNELGQQPFLLKRFGLVYLVALFCVILAGQLYLVNLNFVVKNNVGIATATPDTAAVDDLPLVPGKENPPIDVYTISEPTAEMVANGKALYATTCASCHGEEGKGDGVAGAALQPPPRDFTQKENWKNGRTISGMYKTLQEGIPGGGMVAYDYMPIEDRFALIHYVRTFTDDYPEPTRESLAELDETYNLSAGTKTPPQIPVKRAMRKLAEDNMDVIQQAESALQAIKSGGPNADQFMAVAQDPRTALITLASFGTWQANRSDFVAFVVSDPLQKGFKADVVKLSSGEWTELYNYLSGLLPPVERG